MDNPENDALSERLHFRKSFYAWENGIAKVSATYCGDYIFCRWLEAIESISGQKLSWYSSGHYNSDIICCANDIMRKERVLRIKEACEIIPCPGDIIEWLS